MKTTIVILLLSFSAFAENGIKCPHCNAAIPASQIVELLKASNASTNKPAVTNPRLAALEKSRLVIEQKQDALRTRTSTVANMASTKMRAGQDANTENREAESLRNQVYELEKQKAAIDVEILKIDPDREHRKMMERFDKRRK